MADLGIPSRQFRQSDAIFIFLTAANSHPCILCNALGAEACNSTLFRRSYSHHLPGASLNRLPFFKNLLFTYPVVHLFPSIAHD
jgi:hypothetical protein